ncbi:hypothetical protein K8P03_02940 [Anaerococcus murdochii]|uniref:Uncharacterized protein n=1 Tax=Anaerococcus murdochii TaxID=411577 RepID=A0ABS7SXJ5_9FIRM|nr:hypothetical protein [Anaerococcus murdochii]MBZ2386255.1 hypothetical protein [Anaerococcus murdochii]
MILKLQKKINNKRRIRPYQKKLAEKASFCFRPPLKEQSGVKRKGVLGGTSEGASAAPLGSPYERRFNCKLYNIYKIKFNLKLKHK